LLGENKLRSRKEINKKYLVALAFLVISLEHQAQAVEVTITTDVGSGRRD